VLVVTLLLADTLAVVAVTASSDPLLESSFVTVNTFLWLDFETTGLDPELDDIIEVGCILTDRSLRQISSFQSLVSPRPSALARISKNRVVREMHEKTGLLQELGDFVGTYGELKDLSYTESRILFWLDSQPVDTAVMFLCGSGVSHFDHGLVKSRMPLLASRLRYATIDVSVVSRFLDSFVGPGRDKLFPGDEYKEHRALYDAMRALESAELLVEQLDFLVETVPLDEQYSLG